VNVPSTTTKLFLSHSLTLHLFLRSSTLIASCCNRHHRPSICKQSVTVCWLLHTGHMSFMLSAPCVHIDSILAAPPLVSPVSTSSQAVKSLCNCWSPRRCLLVWERCGSSFIFANICNSSACAGFHYLLSHSPSPHAPVPRISRPRFLCINVFVNRHRVPLLIPLCFYNLYLYLLPFRFCYSYPRDGSIETCPA
jgi:hypothetical protein